jgi:hypothetical protein
MRNIFELTKHEQRIVILVVTLLVAIVFVKHLWQSKWQPSSTRLKPLPAATSPTRHVNDEETGDSRD